MNATLQDNLAEWNRAFAEYVKYTSKTPQEALEHKVERLGRALYRGFSAHQFGGSPRQRGIAVSELAARTAEGEGTRIRPTLLGLYQAQRTALRKEAKAIRQSFRNFGGTLDNWSSLKTAQDLNRAQRLTAWQDIVGREVASRQSGIGVLAAAFLWYRYRGKGEARHLVPNRRGKTLGSVTVGDGVAVIVGMVDGINTVDERYGVVRKAINDETDDTMKYVKDHQDAAAEKLARSVISG
jgi:hypothetical protein